MPDREALLAPVAVRRAQTAQREAIEQRILQAATSAFARSGFDGATTKAIALDAGLPKANLHYYFPTKQDLYRAVLADILAAWLDEARAWITADRLPADALAGYVRAKLALSRDRPEASRIFAGELLRGAPVIQGFLAGELRRTVGTLAAIITRWHDERRIDAPDPVHLLFAIWAMTQTYADFGVQMRAVLGVRTLATQDFEDAVTTVTRLVLRGCGLQDAIARGTMSAKGEFA